MSHTTEWEGFEYPAGAGEKTLCEVTFLHNGDYSGPVEIRLSTEFGQPTVNHYSYGGKDFHIAELHVPYLALEYLVLGKMRQDLIGRLESLNQDELRGYFTK